MVLKKFLIINALKLDEISNHSINAFEFEKKIIKNF